MSYRCKCGHNRPDHIGREGLAACLEPGCGCKQWEDSPDTEVYGPQATNGPQRPQTTTQTPLTLKAAAQALVDLWSNEMVDEDALCNCVTALADALERPQHCPDCQEVLKVVNDQCERRVREGVEYRRRNLHSSRCTWHDDGMRCLADKEQGRLYCRHHLEQRQNGEA